jgi:hypothetical protein
MQRREWPMHIRLWLLLGAPVLASAVIVGGATATNAGQSRAAKTLLLYGRGLART